jgi:hypothetical protein
MDDDLQRRRDLNAPRRLCHQDEDEDEQQLTSPAEKDKKHARESGIAAAVTKQTAGRFS